MINDPLCTIRVRGTPVSVNKMYACDSRGRHFLTKAARTWKKAVSEEAWIAWHGVRQRYHASHLLVGQTFRVICTFLGVPEMDVDNMLKCTLDGLKEGIGIDDAYYGEVIAERGLRLSKSDPGVVITITAQSVESLFPLKVDEEPICADEVVWPLDMKNGPLQLVPADYGNSGQFLDPESLAVARDFVARYLAKPKRTRKAKKAS